MHLVSEHCVDRRCFEPFRPFISGIPHYVCCLVKGRRQKTLTERSLRWVVGGGGSALLRAPIKGSIYLDPKVFCFSGNILRRSLPPTMASSTTIQTPACQQHGGCRGDIADKWINNANIIERKKNIWSWWDWSLLKRQRLKLNLEWCVSNLLRFSRNIKFWRLGL